MNVATGTLAIALGIFSLLLLLSGGTGSAVLFGGLAMINAAMTDWT